MKICHCIKITPQELDALEITCNIIKTIMADDMIASAFENETECLPSGLLSEVNELIDFIHDFGD